LGLGGLVSDEMDNLNYERIYSIIMIVGLIGYILNNTINLTFKKHITNER
jgi:ABC-type nitrate/sulfonate/bicarbonate transport system permease component